MFTEKLTDDDIYNMFNNEIGFQYDVDDIERNNIDYDGLLGVTIIEYLPHRDGEDEDEEGSSSVLLLDDFQCVNHYGIDRYYRCAMFKRFGSDYLEAAGEEGYSVSQILSDSILKNITDRKQTTFTQDKRRSKEYENPFKLKPADKKKTGGHKEKISAQIQEV